MLLARKAVMTCGCVIFVLQACGGKNNTAKTPPSSETNNLPAQQSLHDPMDEGIVLDTTYRVFLVENPQKQIGERRLTVKRHPGGYSIEEYSGWEADELFYEFSTKLVYGDSPTSPVISADVTTQIDTEVVMSASIEVEPGLAVVSAALNTVHEDGSPGDYHEEKALPEGIVLFPQILSLIGHDLLPEPGQLKDVTFSDLPADYESAVFFKTGCTLIREPPEADGRYAFRLLEPSGDPAMVIHFDSGGRCTKEVVYNFIFIPAPASD